ARNAFDNGSWARMAPHARQGLLWKIGETLQERAEEFAQLEAIHNRKSAMVAQFVDVTWSAEIFKYYAGLASKIAGRTITPSVPWAPGTEWHTYTLREAIGVCGQIIPWNFPLLMAAFKLGPVLATGNTVVLKPAEQTPLTALLLGELMLECGLPPGV